MRSYLHVACGFQVAGLLIDKHLCMLVSYPQFLLSKGEVALDTVVYIWCTLSEI